MLVEIKGRELTATYHQGRLYLPKPFRDMFGLKDHDILVIKIVEHTHNYKKRNKPNKNMGKGKDDDAPHNGPPNGIDLEVPNLMDDKFPTPGPIRLGNEDDEDKWWDDDN